MTAAKTMAWALMALCTPAYAYAESHVRFINAAPPELQSIVISIDDTALSELAFGRSTTRTVLADGARRVKISTNTDQGSVTLTEKTISFAAGKYYTVFIWGTLVPASYDMASYEDEAAYKEGYLRARYALLSKGIVIDGTTYQPTVGVHCEGMSALTVIGTPFTSSAYTEVSHPRTWNGGLCRVTITVVLNGTSVPVWQDITNYYFSPHTNQTFVSIGTDAARLVILREVDNK